MNRLRLFLIAVTIAMLGAIAIFVAQLVMNIGTFRQAMIDFPIRHLEATETIERTYSYFCHHGSWPTAGECGALPSDWEFSNNDFEEGGSFLLLRGPYHMTLCYRFIPPRQGKISNLWTLSVEGDKKEFAAGTAYVVMGPKCDE
jgi:hypothetical protein